MATTGNPPPQLPVFAVAGSTDGLDAVPMRDAQCAAHAADAAARVSGRPAAAAAVGLADSLRLAAGLVTACGDRSSVVAAVALDGQDADLALPALRTASRTLVDSRGGGDPTDEVLAALDLSAPVAVVFADERSLASFLSGLAGRLTGLGVPSPGPGRADDEEIAAALPALREARRPVLMLGRGAVASGDLDSLATLARTWGVPVCLTYAATGMPAGRLEKLLPAFGVDVPILPAGTVPWSQALARADRILALGSGLSEADWFGLSDARLVRCPVTRVALGAEADGVAETVVDAEAGRFAVALANELERGGVLTRDGWVDRFSEARVTWTQLVDDEAERGAGEDRLTAALAAREIVSAAPADTVFLGEGGAAGMWLASYAWLRPLMLPSQHATIGASLAMAAGVAEAEPDRPVWAVVGDGAFFYSARELAGLAERGVPLVAFVFDDRSWNAIRLVQTLFFRHRTIATDLPDVDYGELSTFHGCERVRARTPGELARALSIAQEPRSGPLVVDVRLGKGAIPFVGANLILAEVDGVLRSLAGSVTLGSALAAAKDRPALAANLRVISGALRR